MFACAIADSNDSEGPIVTKYAAPTFEERFACATIDSNDSEGPIVTKPKPSGLSRAPHNSQLGQLDRHIVWLSSKQWLVARRPCTLLTYYSNMGCWISDTCPSLVA